MERRVQMTRSFPPLFVMTAAVVVLALMLPNALNLPQQDPSPVLEYAPVPPSDDTPPNPPPGNLSSLALGSTSTLSEALEGALENPPGEGEKPLQKLCVRHDDGVLRQTEDPMSPPCVPFYKGDNGGETWQGVSGDEIRVLVYFDVGSYNDESSPASGSYIDIDRPPLAPCPKRATSSSSADECDHQLVRQTRAMARYFNARFQTYGRHVHFWVYFARGGSEVARRSDAVENWETIRPFAVIDQATFLGNNIAYQDALAARGVMVFTSETALPREFFNRYPSFAWGFWPDVENWARLYSTYICTKVAPFPVRRYGNPGGSDPLVNGKDRVFGLFYFGGKSEPGLSRFVDLVKQQLRACGVEPAATATFPENRFVTNTRDTGVDQQQAVAEFKEAGVTTVLYLGGVEGKFSQLADRNGYYPEIVIADDLFQGNNVTAREQNQVVWQNAWAVHFQVRFDRPETTPGFTAYRDAYPQAPLDEARYVNDVYRDHFMLFTAIQVAGPQLNPTNVDRGFHAIPERASDNPYIASCFFAGARDFSCVKDATEIWWDPVGRSPGDGKPGCWRYVDEGDRYLAGTWPAGETKVFRNDDPCGGYDAARRARLG